MDSGKYSSDNNMQNKLILLWIEYYFDILLKYFIIIKIYFIFMLRQIIYPVSSFDTRAFILRGKLSRTLLHF